MAQTLDTNQVDDLGRKTGYWKIYDYGTLVSEGNMVRDTMDGHWKMYMYGYLFFEGNFEMGKRIGK